MINHEKIDTALKTMKCSDCNSKIATNRMYFISNDNSDQAVFCVNRKKPIIGKKVCCEKFAIQLEEKCGEIMGSYFIISSDN